MNSNLSNKLFSANYSLGTGIFIKANSNLSNWCVFLKKKERKKKEGARTKYLMKPAL